MFTGAAKSLNEFMIVQKQSAAVGLVLTMIGALMVNVRNGNRLAILENIVLLLLATFVAYGRFVLVPA